MKLERPSPPAPQTPRTHLQRADALAHAVLGIPLPCACPDCGRALARWEGGRAHPAETARQLPPTFWIRQEFWIGSRLAEKSRVRRAWFLAPVAAALVLASAFFLIPAAKKAPYSGDQVKRYEAALQALDRPALGDLEACSLLFIEGGTTDKEDSL